MKQVVEQEAPPLLIRKPEAARMLGVSLSTVRTLVREGTLETVQIRGRMPMLRRADIERLARDGAP
jgi:excisionase family DNA binding protein